VIGRGFVASSSRAPSPENRCARPGSLLTTARLKGETSCRPTREATWSHRAGGQGLALAHCRRASLLQPALHPGLKSTAVITGEHNEYRASAHVEITCREMPKRTARARGLAISRGPKIVVGLGVRRSGSPMWAVKPFEAGPACSRPEMLRTALELVGIKARNLLGRGARCGCLVGVALDPGVKRQTISRNRFQGGLPRALSSSSKVRASCRQPHGFTTHAPRQFSSSLRNLLLPCSTIRRGITRTQGK